MTPKRDLKTAIIDAAMIEFEQQGYADTTLKAIAARADTSRRTIQRYFLDKKAVFHAVIDEMTSATLNLPFPEFTPGFPVRDQLEDFVHTLFRFFSDDRNCRMCRIVIAELARQPELSVGQTRNSGALEKHIGQWLKEAMQAGSLRQGRLEVAAKRLLGLVQSHSLWPVLLRDQRPEDPIAVAKDIVDFFLTHYGIEGR